LSVETKDRIPLVYEASIAANRIASCLK